MPFVQRVVEPKYLSRTSLHNENGQPLIKDNELEAVTNNTLSNALRQLASLVLVANDIFTELTAQLNVIGERSRNLQHKIVRVESEVEKYDPKQVPVPESDICTFALRTAHFHSVRTEECGLFTAKTRPHTLQALYEAAAATPVIAMRQLDRWRRDGHRSSRFFLCTPVLGSKRRKIINNIDVEIETRLPVALDDLRRWTSTEALGDITVTPDCLSRIAPSASGDATDGEASLSVLERSLDHKLPSPEEQVQAVALKFPAVVVAVDVSGRGFDRMTVLRRSLLHVGLVRGMEGSAEGTTSSKHRSRSRKPRGKRRNTITGTDQREIRQAISGEPLNTDPASPDNSALQDTAAVTRSQSSDLLKSSSLDTKKSHFNTLKQWGKSRLKLMSRSAESKTTEKVSDIDDVNIYETVTMRRRRNLDKGERKVFHERKPSYSSSEKSMSIPTPTPPVVGSHVKLRDSSAQRRQRRTGVNKDEPHSSSGNWSASSESGRASVGSEITTHPRSTPTATTSNNSLNQHVPGSSVSRRRFLNTSASSSVTSEGTLTPELHDLHDDGETSSVYSCDTEGYYTSFHMDSGLKTLKEEEMMPSTPLHSTTAFTNSSGNQTVLSAENEYELFGKGSTSTTTSSAGTVCTTLLAALSNRSLVIGPAVPERKSSLTKLDRSHSSSSNNDLERSLSSSTAGSTLERAGTIKRNGVLLKKETVVAMVHSNKPARQESPDSGHNTSSSPIESMSSPNGQRSCSEFEYSESSDLEGVDRIERIRVKTTINSSRIPSMCVITPPQSDDESDKSVTRSSHGTTNKTDTNDFGSKNVHRPKLDLPLTNLHRSNEAKDSAKHECSSNKLLCTDNNQVSGYATIQNKDTPQYKKSESKLQSTQVTKKSPLLLNNMLDKLRGVLPALKKSPIKDTVQEPVYDSAGDYVTIADVRNNNQKPPQQYGGVYYSNDVVKRNLATVLSGKLRETEYVSLNELPCNARDIKQIDSGVDSLERKQRQGARVTLDAEGRVVYSSDSLRRRKGAHTTFEPGPHVKDVTTPASSPLVSHRTPKIIRPANDKPRVVTRPLSPLTPQVGKVIIRAASVNSPVSSPTSDFVRLPPSTIVTASARPTSPKERGARVNMQDVTDSKTTSSSTKDEGYQRLSSNPAGIGVAPVVKKNTVSPIDLRYGMCNEDNTALGSFQRRSPAYWTLQSRKPSIRDMDKRPSTPEIPPKSLLQQGKPTSFSYSTPTKVDTSPVSKIPMGISNFFSPIKKQSEPTEVVSQPSVIISPIDPRNSNQFLSSTPSKPENSNIEVPSDITKKITQTKSTMSNEELYAVIHKSKKKMNIKTTDAERCASPASSSASSSISDKTERLIDPSISSPNENPTNKNIPVLLKKSEIQQTQEFESKQSSACSDRLGPVHKTSRLDFKKLLSQHGTKTLPACTRRKLSAVEQLKISKHETQENTSLGVAILDLSRSPKSFVTRRTLNRMAQNVGSPVKDRNPTKLISPRTAWRFSNPRSDVLSSPIQEVCSEDDSPNSSSSKTSIIKPTADSKPPQFIKPGPILAYPFPNISFSEQIKPSTTCRLNSEEERTHPVKESLTMKDNLFIKTEENNFMKCEMNKFPQTPLNANMTRSQFNQAQRAKFLSQPPANTMVTAQFRNGHYTGMSSGQPESPRKPETPKCPSPPTLETAL